MTALPRLLKFLSCFLVGSALTIGVVCLPPLPTPHRSRTATTASNRTSEDQTDAYRNLPISFEANCGQADPAVKFLSRTGSYDLFLAESELLLASKTQTTGTNQAHRRLRREGRVAPIPPSTSLLRIKLKGANVHAKIEGLDELPGKCNYFIGSDPRKWCTSVPNYAKVSYTDIYPGVDLVFYGNSHQLEHDFVVAPGIDFKVIRFRFEGAQHLDVDRNGDLVVQTDAGELRQRRPLVYQVEDGVKRDVPADYVIMSTGEIGFEVPSYDPALPLVLDPVLSYSTYLGGSNGDSGIAIAVDSAGNAYIAGATASVDFAITGGAFQKTFGGPGAPPLPYDVFVTKLNATGTAVLYSTYLGGNDYEVPQSIAVDSGGNAYVTGSVRSANFPTTPGAFQTVRGDSVNAFVTKLNAAGSSLIYSTYLGGSDINHTGASEDDGLGIAVDPLGNAYVVGAARTSNFPTTSGAFQTAHQPRATQGFVTKFNSSGSGLVYSTYLTGSSFTVCSALAVDFAGHAYVAGYTADTDFPTMNPIQANRSGGFLTCSGGGDGFGPCIDAFVTELGSEGSSLIYSTYLGGSEFDYGSGIALDSLGNVYVTGRTFSVDFPTTMGAIQTARAGRSYDVFVTKITPSGTALVYSTYLGGADVDIGNGIAVDASGNAYVVGTTSSEDFPAKFALQSEKRGSGDAFVSKLNTTGTELVYSTYLGGAKGGTAGYGVAVDNLGCAYVTGATSSGKFPTTSSAAQQAYASNFDAFITKLAMPLITSVAISGKQLIVNGDGFDVGSKIFLDGEKQKTQNEESNPQRMLIAVKAGKRITPGQTVTVQVRNPDGSLSNEYRFTRPDADQ